MGKSTRQSLKLATRVAKKSFSRSSPFQQQCAKIIYTTNAIESLNRVIRKNHQNAR